MSKLKKYIEEVKRKTEGYSDIEKLRYVYLDLGKRFAFDLNFSFGNSREKKEIYSHSGLPKELEKSMEDNIIICKSISYIYEHIAKQLGIKAESIKAPEDYRKYPHMYNIITTKEDQKYKFDLQEDMRYIKANMRTKHFGKAIDEEQDLVTRKELENIDRKLQYINKDQYYTDEYLELIKLNMQMFENLEEKAEFVFNNLDAYVNKNMKYADRRWRMEDIIGTDYQEGLIFSKEDKKKINIVDCYKKINGEKKYKLGITVAKKNGIDVYMFSEEMNSFEKLTLEQFAEQVENGLVNIQGIQGLKAILRNRKEEKEK